MWTTTFCPNFTIWSFTFLNVLIQLIIFIASVIFTSTTDQGINDHWFLGNSLETLEKWGMRMPYKIKDNAEIYRLVLSLYVNQGFTQIVINLLAQMFSGFPRGPTGKPTHAILFLYCRHQCKLVRLHRD